MDFDEAATSTYPKGSLENPLQLQGSCVWVSLLLPKNLKFLQQLMEHLNSATKISHLAFKSINMIF